MKITITDHRKIFAVQKEFSEMFPYLRLEFYSKQYKRGNSLVKSLMKHISKSIAECRTKNSSDNIEIQPQTTVSGLKQGFNDVYGLTAEVFRKSGNLWLEITDSTDQTLEQQNGEAKEMSKLQGVM